ncbi:MAG: nucleotidyltransferase family protein [Bryobacteraceae bacterium]
MRVGFDSAGWEMRALVAAASAGADGDAAALREHAARGCDWQRVVELAETHSLRTLLYRRVSDAVGEAAAPAAVRALAQPFRANAIRNLQAVAEIRSIVGLLAAAGIPALALKGPALAVSAYGDLTLREFSDVDMLVPRAALEAALAALAGAGYRVTDAPAARWLPGTMEVALMRGSGGLTIDLHWRLIPKYFGSVPEDSLCAEARSVEIAGARIPVLAPEAELVFLAVNGARECWPTLRAVADVAHLVRSQPLDWGRAGELAAASGASRALAVALLLAGSLLQAPVPEEVLKRAEAVRAARPLAERFAARLLENRPDVSGTLGEAALHLSQLASPVQKASYIVRRMCQPSQLDAQWLPLPRRLSAAYYLVRPVRLALRCVGLAAKRSAA